MKESADKPCLIGIAGGTGSGKTTLCRKLVESIQGRKPAVIYVDSYYRSQHHLTLEQRYKTNYDNPDSLEFELLTQHVRDLMRGRTVEIPVYDFALHDRKDVHEFMHPDPLILVEGILSLYPEQLRALYDFKIFVDCPAEIRFQRRLDRDIRERGRTEESVRAQWRETVEPMHDLFCQTTKQWADLVVDGRSISAEVVKMVTEKIESLL